MEIIITGFSASLTDSQKARAVPLNELPQLNDEQREVARKFEMSEEDYARQVLAFQYGGTRLQAGAAKLARVIEERLPGLVPGVDLEKLIYEVGLEDHKMWLRHADQHYVVRLSQTDVDDWLARGRPEDFDQLCRAIARQLA